MIDDAKEIAMLAMALLIVGFVIPTIVSHNEAIQPVLPANTTVINNYYCNISEPIPYGVYVQDYVYNETTLEVENITCATPAVTPTLWDDTRKVSVGLPADGYKNPCCPHCTPTPTPACEFPWWCEG